MQSNEQRQQSLVLLAKMSSDVELAVLESNGQLTPEIEKALEVVAQELPAKVDSYAFLMDRMGQAAEWYSARADQYKAVSKACDNVVLRLKNNIKAAMNLLGASKVEGHEHKFSITPMASKLVITGDVPREYMKEVVKLEVDKDAIRSALVLGEKLTFAHLEEVFALRGGFKR